MMISVAYLLLVWLFLGLSRLGRRGSLTWLFLLCWGFSGFRNRHFSGLLMGLLSWGGCVNWFFLGVCHNNLINCLFNF